MKCCTTTYTMVAVALVSLCVGYGMAHLGSKCIDSWTDASGRKHSRVYLDMHGKCGGKHVYSQQKQKVNSEKSDKS